MKILKFLLIFLYACSFAQEDGFRFQDDERKQTISFQLINNLIFIPLTVNGVELTFMLDTGVAETLLFSLENKEINFYDVEKVRFSGLGGNVEIEGLKSVKNIVQAGGTLKDYNHTIYIILNEDFNISSHIGIPVNGIIGYHFFKNYPVKIDYSTKKLTVYADHDLREEKRYEKIPVSLEQNKPYLTAGILLRNKLENYKLLLDLGNSDPLWLFPSQISGFEYNSPNIDDFLGRGFNGDVFGKRSRIRQLRLTDNFFFDKPLMAMPNENSIQHVAMVQDRKGSVGAEILRRFTLIVNYPKNTLFLRKNKNYRDPFYLNMSGMDLRHDGMFWDRDLVKVQTVSTPYGENTVSNTSNTVSSSFQYKFTLKPEYSVAGVRQDSPAFRNGIQKGDKFLLINGRKASDMTLQNIYDLMKSEEGKKINLQMNRKGEILKFSIVLEDPIPFKN